jgi:hypothetical protein
LTRHLLSPKAPKIAAACAPRALSPGMIPETFLACADDLIALAVVKSM